MASSDTQSDAPSAPVTEAAASLEPTTCADTECSGSWNGPPAPTRFAAFRRFWCRLRGHAFVEFSGRCKRRCVCCGREEWLMSRPFPLIGQAKHFWQHMDFDR